MTEHEKRCLSKKFGGRTIGQMTVNGRKMKHGQPKSVHFPKSNHVVILFDNNTSRIMSRGQFARLTV